MTNALKWRGHPQLLVERIAARRGVDLMFSYSRYEVARPGLQAAAKRSVVLRVSAGDVTPDWLVERFAELGPTEEMAWHSLVECKGVGCHIPMVDFVNRPAHSELREISRKLATEMGLNGDFVFFETGQSFHGYFPDLIPEHAWHQHLGRLLVLNEHEGPPVIDSRWVGHALVRGFGALRWSHNTNRYLAMPHLISVFEPDRR